MELVLVNPQHYGIEEKKAYEIIGNLPQIKKEREILEEQYNEVITLDIEDSSTSIKARELRLKIRDNRTKGIDPWHKSAKDYFLKGGQFVDAIKKIEVSINERMEESLELIEKYHQLKEQKAKEELKAFRLMDIAEFMEFVPNGIDLGSMTDAEYVIVFNGAKLQYEGKVKRLQEEESARIEKERLAVMVMNRTFEVSKYSMFIEDGLDLSMSDIDYEKMLIELDGKMLAYQKEQEAIREENARLKLEADAKEAALKIERQLAQEEAARLEVVRQSELKLEREKQAKLQAEIQVQKDLVKKIEEERLAKEARDKKEAAKLAKAPVKQKMTLWVNSFKLPSTDVDNEVSKEIIEKFELFKKWSVQTIEKL